MLITAASVTPEKQQDAIAAATSFVHLGTTLAARQRELAGSMFAGVYISPRVGRLKPLYLCTLGKVEGADGTTEQRFVAQGANNGSSLQPESAPLSIVQNAVFLAEVGSTPLPPLWAANAGSPFRKADLDAVPSVQTLIPEDDMEYRVVLGPKCLPAFFGFKETCRGPIDENTFDTLEVAFPGSGLWANWMNEWSQEFQTAVLADKKKLGPKFPKVKKHCQPLADSALSQTETLYVEGDENKPALDSLRKRLFAAVPAANPEPSEVKIPDPEPSITSIASSTVRNSLSKRIPRKSTLASYPVDEILATKLQLANLVYDPTTGAVGVPVIKEETDYMVYSLDTPPKRAEQLEDSLRSWVEACDTDTDFLRRLLDPPNMDKAGKAMIINSLHAIRPMVDFATTTKDKFRWYMLAPDNAATIRMRDATNDARDLQELCGEDKSNLTKVNTSITFNEQVLAPEPFLTLLANRCGLVESLVVVNLDKWDDVANPLVYRFCRELAMYITTHVARQWLKTTPYATTRRFFGWLVQMVDMYECHLHSIPSNSRNVLHVLEEELSKIPLDSVRKAEQLKEEVFNKILKILTSTETVPTCSLVTSIETIEAKKRLAEKPGTPARPPKEPKTETPAPAVAAKDVKGCIVYRRRGTMPAPTEDDPSRRICAAFVRQGTACRRGDRCDWIHSLAPETWPIESLKSWAHLVDTDNNLSWTSDVKKDAIKAALAKADATTTGA